MIPGEVRVIVKMFQNMPTYRIKGDEQKDEDSIKSRALLEKLISLD